MRFSRPLVLLILLAALIAPAALAQEAAVVTLQPVAFVPLEGETFTTDVTIENATDLLGFQFDLNFDPAAFAVDSIELGPFLSSTGRSTQPLGPDLRAAGEGRAVYGGFTLGTPEQPGAAGSGVLATVTWRVVQPADFTATLSRVQLAGPGGQALPGSDTSSLPPAAATVEQPAVEQPTVAAPEPTPAPATENQTGSGLAGPAGLVAILVITGGLYALWRISHKPGGNRSAD